MTSGQLVLRFGTSCRGSDEGGTGGMALRKTAPRTIALVANFEPLMLTEYLLAAFENLFDFQLIVAVKQCIVAG